MKDEELVPVDAYTRIPRREAERIVAEWVERGIIQSNVVLVVAAFLLVLLASPPRIDGAATIGLVAGFVVAGVSLVAFAPQLVVGGLRRLRIWFRYAPLWLKMRIAPYGWRPRVTVRLERLLLHEREGTAPIRVTMRLNVGLMWLRWRKTAHPELDGRPLDLVKRVVSLDLRGDVYVSQGEVPR